MTVQSNARSCRRCGSELEILDADEQVLSVACLKCGDCYVVQRDNRTDPRIMDAGSPGGDQS